MPLSECTHLNQLFWLWMNRSGWPGTKRARVGQKRGTLSAGCAVAIAWKHFFALIFLRSARSGVPARLLFLRSAAHIFEVVGKSANLR